MRKIIVMLAVALVFGALPAPAHPGTVPPGAAPSARALPEPLDLYLQARLAEAGDRYREALELYAKALEAEPDNVEIRIAYASLLSTLGMPGRAVDLLHSREDLDWYGRKVLAMALARQASRQPELLGEAERRLRAVLAERADDPNVQIDLARILMQQGKNAEAAKLLDGVIRQRPGFPRLQLLDARALEAAGRTDEAIAMYRRCAEDPNLGAACGEGLVSALEDAGRPAEAARFLLESASADDEVSRLEAARLLLQAGQPEEALKAVDSVLAVNPESSDAIRLRARALARLGRAQEAEAAIRKLIKKEPDDIGARLTLVWVAMSQKNLPRARKELGKAWQAAGKDGASPAGVQVCLTGARLELLAQHPGMAREWLGKIQTPELAGRDLPVLLAETYRRTGDWRDGVGALLRIQPRLDGATREIAQALEAEMRLRSGDRRGMDILHRLARKGSHAGALAALQVAQTLELWDDLLELSDTVLERFPDDQGALFSKASALERSGHAEKAAVVFQKILELDPDDAMAANYLGYMWADAGEHLDEALKLIQKAVAADPESGAYLDSLGWVYYRMGNLEQAEHWLRMAVRNGATDGTVLAHLGEVLLERGKKDEALELLRRALDLGCEHPDHVRELVEKAGGDRQP